MAFNVTFNNISVISGGQFYWWRNPGYLPQVTDKLYAIKAYKKNKIAIAIETEQICGHLGHTYCVTVNQVTMTT